MQKKTTILTIALAALLLLPLAGCTSICTITPSGEEPSPQEETTRETPDDAQWESMDAHWTAWLNANGAKQMEPVGPSDAVAEAAIPSEPPTSDVTVQDTSTVAGTRPQTTTPPANNSSGNANTQTPPTPPTNTPPASTPPTNNNTGTANPPPTPPPANSNSGGPTVVSPPSTNQGENSFGGTDFGGGGAGCFWNQ